MFVAQRAGLDPARLFPDQPSFLLWKDILEEGARNQLNRAVVAVARDQNPNNPRRPFLDALLTTQLEPVSLDRQPRGADGAPVFIKSDDAVSEPEALLFHDDLTIQVGRIPWLISVLEKLQAIAPSVCRLMVNWPIASQRGTGFLIGPDILLTNWHVLHHGGAGAAQVKAEFGYDDDGHGGGLASTALDCDVGTIRGDPADDWAVIRLSRNLDGQIPIVKLSEAVEPSNNDLAFIIQHPGGERKRVAFVRNQVTSFDNRVVHYLSDTQTGSSGSPVFHESGRLMALHHAGGRPQEVAGKAPLRKNEGIRIPRILEGLAQVGVTVP
jgi:V8-like Glu-specific endopeptidase